MILCFRTEVNRQRALACINNCHCKFLTRRNDRLFTSLMNQSLDDFINQVRMADGIEHERFYIATETAHIRAYTRGGDPEMRPRVVSKLVFLDMLGENTAFGHLEAITLMGHDLFYYKRVGFI